MNLFRVLIDHWIVWNKVKVGFPTLVCNQDQNQKPSQAGYLLPISRPWHRLHVLDTSYTFLSLDTDYMFHALSTDYTFSNTSPITHFSALGTDYRFFYPVLSSDYKFSCAWYRLQVFPCLAPIPSFPPALASISCFLVLATDYTFTALGDGCILSLRICFVSFFR